MAERWYFVLMRRPYLWNTFMLSVHHSYLGVSISSKALGLHSREQSQVSTTDTRKPHPRVPLAELARSRAASCETLSRSPWRLVDGHPTTRSNGRFP